MKKLICLIVTVGILSLLPKPPINKTVSAEIEKPPSTTQPKTAISTLTTQTTPVQPVQAPVAVVAVPTTTPAPTQATSTPTVVTEQSAYTCGDNYYANKVYMTESSCTLTSVNASSGDYGIGQSAGGLSSACPDWRTDYACQNAFFSAYMQNRYGSWQAAWEHELNEGWW